ncbi:hypothetical protein TNCT_361181 [Trichonephila clavata]|uniref:Uncharacterized protein n=1 Tax=Trichonephila clavata TaxID=2740835 RepID=A0A8X6JXX0_TRICU|nr:hypothetical protein TNCT_361181 [Trichonephila clavata]
MFTSTAGSSPWTQGEWEGEAGVFVEEKAIAEGGGTFSGQGQLNLGRSFLGRAYTDLKEKEAYRWGMTQIRWGRNSCGDLER